MPGLVERSRSGNRAIGLGYCTASQKWHESSLGTQVAACLAPSTLRLDSTKESALFAESGTFGGLIKDDKSRLSLLRQQFQT